MRSFLPDYGFPDPRNAPKPDPMESIAENPTDKDPPEKASGHVPDSPNFMRVSSSIVDHHHQPGWSPHDYQSQTHLHPETQPKEDRIFSKQELVDSNKRIEEKHAKMKALAAESTALKLKSAAAKAKIMGLEEKVAELTEIIESVPEKNLNLKRTRNS